VSFDVKCLTFLNAFFSLWRYSPRRSLFAWRDTYATMFNTQIGAAVFNTHTYILTYAAWFVQKGTGYLEERNMFW